MHNISYLKDTGICVFRTVVSWYDQNYNRKHLIGVMDDFGNLVNAHIIIPHGFTLGVEGRY